MNLFRFNKISTWVKFMVRIGNAINPKAAAAATTSTNHLATWNLCMCIARNIFLFSLTKDMIVDLIETDGNNERKCGWLAIWPISALHLVNVIVGQNGHFQKWDM